MAAPGKIRTILVASVFILVIGLIFKNSYDSQTIDQYGVYVIGTVEKVNGAYKGIRAFVSYKYRGYVFKSDFVSNDMYMGDKGKRLFFKINPEHPKKYRIEYNVTVPDSIKEAPFDGWKRLPVN